MGMMKRFSAYLSRLCEVLGHADRDAPMREYCTGLMLPLRRKSVEPIAAAYGFLIAELGLDLASILIDRARDEIAMFQLHRSNGTIPCAG